MNVTGKYKMGINFITVFSSGRIYTVARDTGDWRSVEIGQRTDTGLYLTPEEYDRMESECKLTGTFNLFDYDPNDHSAYATERRIMREERMDAGCRY